MPNQTTQNQEKTKSVSTSNIWLSSMVPIAKVLCAVAVLIVEQLITSSLVFKNTLPTFFISLGLCAIFLASLIAFIYRRNKKHNDQEPHSMKHYVKTWFYNAAKIIILSIIVNGVSTLIFNALKIHNSLSENQQALDKLAQVSQLNHIYTTIFVVIIAPITEEFVFRYIPALYTKHIRGWLISFAILFVLSHLIGDLITLNFRNPASIYLVLSHAVIYAVPAYFITNIYYKERNMIANTGTHMLWNLISVLV